MSDHEFEKQVHQKLEELKLRPSDAVWMEVQKNIRQDKRRRRFMWLWVPLLFICLSTSAYILYHNSFNTASKQAIAKATPAAMYTAETATTPINNTPAVQNSDNKPNTEAHTLNSTPSINTPQPVVTAAETTPVTTLSNKKQPVVVKTGTPIGNIAKQSVQKPHADPVVNDNPPAATINTITRSGHEKPRYRKKKTTPDQYALAATENPVQQEATLPNKAVQSEQDALNSAMPLLAANGNNDITTNKAAMGPFSNQSFHLFPDSLNTNKPAALPIPRFKPSLWYWGITANAGYSRIAESKLFQLKGLLGQEKYLAEDLSARSSNATAGTSSMINYSGASTTTAKAASPIQPDLAFSAGFFVQRKLSPRLKLSLGLEYTYMSVNTEIGKKVNEPTVVNMGTSSAAVVPEYYKGAVHPDAQSALNRDSMTMYNHKYRYRFQYIEIPLMVNWQINKGRKLPPIVFEGGVSLSRLLSVDALHYEGLKGIYYQDNNLFSKTSINFITGISVGLLQRSKHPIWIGPDLRYALNGLVKKDVSTGQYLWSTGISVKMLLGKF